MRIFSKDIGFNLCIVLVPQVVISSCNHVIALRGVVPIRDGVEERSDLPAGRQAWQSILLSPPSPSRDRDGIGRRDII